MKKILLKILAASFILLSVGTFTSCKDDDTHEVETTITVNDLPTAAQAFLKKYFPEYSVQKIIKNIEENVTIYEVSLEDGDEVDFDALGEWIQVNSEYGKTIPTGFIPEPIIQTLDYQYNGYGIAEINTSGQNYHLVLSNNQGGDSIELVFNQSGEIIPGNQ